MPAIVRIVNQKTVVSCAPLAMIASLTAIASNAATTAQAIGNSHATKTAGEQATAIGLPFSYPDGIGNIIYARRVTSGTGDAGGNSREFARSVTAAHVTSVVGGKADRSELAAKADNTFLAAGTGATPRTIAQVLGDLPTRPEEFGALGNNQQDDAPAINRALTAKDAVDLVPGKNYRIEGPIEFKRSGQCLNLNGATITPVGSTNVFNARGGLQNLLAGNGVIERAGMTGGTVIDVMGADRLTFRDMQVHNAWSLAWVRTSNTCHIENVWANNVRGDFGVFFDGNNGRSDILRLFSVNISMPNSLAGSAGIVWRGNAHTLQTQSVTIVRPKIGVLIQNDVGTGTPSFGFFDDLEIDFPELNGVDLVDGEDMFFTPSFYCHGSATASGVRIGANVPASRVTFTGGKITGHNRYGINNAVAVNVSNLTMFGNGVDNFASPDLASSNAPRFKVLPDFFMGIAGTNRVMSYAPGFSMGHDPSGGTVYADVGGQTHLRLGGNSAEVWIDGQLRTVTLGAADANGKRPLLVSG